MFDMRLRIPELMAARGIETAYRLHHASGRRISMTNAYHLVDKAGRIDRVSMAMLEALCDVFDVTPGELLERDKPEKRKR